MDPDDFLLFYKSFSILISLTSFIPLTIQHAIPSGQKMWMNTAAQVFIIFFFWTSLKDIDYLSLMKINYPILW